LSEQTDMMDLLGSEYPVASAEDEEEIKFSWCDGVLLQAIKQGYWFLIDEMNLA
jgi:midasin